MKTGQGYKEGLKLTLDIRAKGGRYPIKLGVVLGGLDKTSILIETVATRILLKEGQGTMTDLAKEELATKNVVKVESRNWPQQQRYFAKNRNFVIVDGRHGTSGRSGYHNGWFECFGWIILRICLPD